MRIKTCLFISCFSLTTFAQESTDRLPTYFGLQVRPVLPVAFRSDKIVTMKGDGLESSITQGLGYGFGGIIRANITKLIAFKTGINFTHRSFDLTVALPDSNIFAEREMTFIEYDIPVNALIYIQLSDRIFMNTSLGVSVSYKPTPTLVQIETSGKHEFSLYAARKSRLGLGLNANIGFEYRTKKSGFFYLGGAARVPFSQLFNYVAMYKYGANTTTLKAEVDGSFLAIDFNYFFPLIKNKGVQVRKGPIE